MTHGDAQALEQADPLGGCGAVAYDAGRRTRRTWAHLAKTTNVFSTPPIRGCGRIT